MSNPFPKKQYGRIFVMHKDHIDKVNDIMKKIDDYEYDYCPDNLVTLYDSKIPLIYLHKFEMCKDKITYECLKKGIFVWCVSFHLESYIWPEDLK